jgi:hypothetical protein
MFERFSEKARRTIFFARFEASQYGSPYIETEHMLLGLFREEPKLAKLIPGMTSLSEIRAEIERHIERREQISTSVEVPLTAQCKRALNFAAEEANHLGDRHVGTEHLLLGLLRIDDGLAATILHAAKIDLLKLRDLIRGGRPTKYQSTIAADPTPPLDATTIIDWFVASLREGISDNVQELFAEDACYVEASGKLWQGRNKILANRDILLAPFAKRGAKPIHQAHTHAGATLLVATLIWENVHFDSFSRLDLYRMSVVFRVESDVPAVSLIQLTAIGRGAVGRSAVT